MSAKYLFVFLLLPFMACKQNTKTTVPDTSVEIQAPDFNADSAYHYTDTQVQFGPRVPNTSNHKECGDYLAEKLKQFGAKVTEQEATLRLQDNTPLKIRNIIGTFYPENINRVLLFAHWDTRPYADRDPNPDNWNKPIDGANDGAGACGALLEIARQINMQQPTVGVDIIFFDAEDWGAPEFPVEHKHYGDWCMGSDYWSKNPHVPGYKARFGILLDMVSAPDAQFYKDAASVYYAKPWVEKVWKAAHVAGYNNFFLDKSNDSMIMDDHIPVNQSRKIPSLNIVDYSPDNEHGFGDYWHTMEDNMNNVSKQTLKAVGQTVLHVLYNEK